MTLHWCGTGLSAVPGLRRLIRAGHDVTVWERQLDRAEEAVGDLTQRLREFDGGALEAELAPGDVLISMAPATAQAGLAALAITRGAHFVSADYITPEIRSLNARAQLKGVCLVNEMGLDPGLDHLMAHHLVGSYRASRAYAAGNTLSFTSYCGGIPRDTNAFRYKFSWSPLGVLKALRAPSRSIRHFARLDIARPWEAVGRYDAPLAQTESFEVYPNRDSLPYIDDYAFDPTWKLRDFVRGTLRPVGWSEAWADIFAELASIGRGEDAEMRLRDMSDALWARHAYGPDEPDRVVLCVSLRAESEGRTTWHKTFALDAWGDARGSAMARLVSVPVSLAAEAVLAREIAPGVTSAPSDPRLVQRCLSLMEEQAQHLTLVDHLR